ncbi:MAG TPA: response regulator, partial [Anaerolineae bacterium]|nr:response regulator [Anaerolineae bacterium]
MKTILIVDDEPVTLTVLECLLQQHGYQILLAHDGSEALDLLRRRPIDLILADVAMPGLNGYQLCEQV